MCVRVAWIGLDRCSKLAHRALKVSLFLQSEAEIVVESRRSRLNRQSLTILSNRGVHAASLVHRHGEVIRSERIIGVGLEYDAIFSSRLVPLSFFTQSMRQCESQIGVTRCSSQ